MLALTPSPYPVSSRGPTLLPGLRRLRLYGGSNSNNLIDETGSANAPEVGDASSGESIERTDLAGSWQIQSSPTPNSTSL